MSNMSLSGRIWAKHGQPEINLPAHLGVCRGGSAPKSSIFWRSDMAVQSTVTNEGSSRRGGS